MPDADAAPAPSGSPWIISAGQDLLWFHASVIPGVALLLAFLALPQLDDASYTTGHPAVMLLFAWGLLFDGPHVWGTYARSYLASDEASREGLPGAWSWGIILAGPALAVVDSLAFAPGPSLLGSAGWPFRHFLLFAYLWAYWHLVRQHYGFLMLYRRKAGETSRGGVRLDSLLLWVGCLYPYLRYSLSPAYVASGLPVVLDPAWFEPLRLGLDLGFAATMLGLVGLMLSGRIEPFRLGPKHLLLGVVIAFHLAVFHWLENLLTITATLTIFHNLQYQRIVWQYERGRGRRPSGGLLPYLALGAILGLAWYGPRTLGVALLEPSLGRNLLLGLGWGIAFHHYLVDGRIWRVRRSTSLGTTLDAGAQAG